MINPSFSETVTHYHQKKAIDGISGRSITEWERKLYKNCYFRVNYVESLSGNTLSQASSYTAKIPYDNEKKVFTPGDILVLGEAEEKIENVQGKRTADLIAEHKPDCFIIRTVADNTKTAGGRHYRLTGA